MIRAGQTKPQTIRNTRTILGQVRSIPGIVNSPIRTQGLAVGMGPKVNML